MGVGGLRRGAGVLRRSQGLLAGRGVGVAGGHHGRGHGLLGRSKDLQKKNHRSTSGTSGNELGPALEPSPPPPHMISRGAAASSGAPAVAVLAGAPLRRRGVGVLPLARDRSDGVEHLGGHVAGERIDGTRQVWERRRRGKNTVKEEERRKKMGLKGETAHLRC